MRDELVVPASFGDPAAVEDENLVGVPNRGHTMRDDNRGALAHDAAQPRQDFLFRVGIDCRQRIVRSTRGSTISARASAVLLLLRKA